MIYGGDILDNAEILLGHIKRLYVSCRSHYIISRPGQKYYAPKKDGRFCYLTDNVLLKHLRREYAVGIYASNEGSRFICFDVDDGNPETVSQVINELVTLGLPRERIYVSFSGRKGYHVEAFFDGVVETNRLYNLYQHVILNGSLDPRKVEFRPTQKMAIKLPLSVHGATGNICWFVNPATLEPIEDVMYLAEIEQVHVDDATGALSLPALDSSNGEEHATADRDKGMMGATLTAPGMRHDAMVSIAVYQRSQNASREENQRALEEWYSKQPQGMISSSPEEVHRDIEGILNWVYSERFNAPKPVEKDMASIYAGQMDVVLSQWSRSARRIVFLLLVRMRMGTLHISAADIGKAVGVSIKTVYEVTHKLIAAKTITRKEGRRTLLPDKSYAAESCSYIVPHKPGCPYDMKIDITMRDLISDFDRTYHRALYVLVRQSKLMSVLPPDEWAEYLEWAQVFESDGDVLPSDRRIDLLGHPYELDLPLRLASPVIAYQLDGRWLFPAYDMALILRYAGPSVVGSQCPHKELWQIQVNRRRLPNGMMSHQVLNKNFIPMEDVLDLVSRSSIPEKAQIASYLNSLEPPEDEDSSKEEGGIAS